MLTACCTHRLVTHTHKAPQVGANPARDPVRAHLHVGRIVLTPVPGHADARRAGRAGHGAAAQAARIAPHAAGQRPVTRCILALP